MKKYAIQQWIINEFDGYELSSLRFCYAKGENLPQLNVCAFSDEKLIVKKRQPKSWRTCTILKP